MKLIVILVLFLCCISVVCAELESKTIVYQNETLEITPQLNEHYTSYENITTVFKIQRVNPTNETLIVNYTQRWLLEDAIIFEENLSKEINKYSSAKTGFVSINQSGVFELLFLVNETLSWFVSVNLSESDNANESITDLNSSNNTTNETTTEIPSNKNITTQCNETFSLELNQQKFVVGEKLELDFTLEEQTENFTIEYWIEDIYGNYLKKPFTTTNSNTKSYTFKPFNSQKTIYFVVAKFRGCKDVISEEFAIVSNDKYIEKNEDESSIKVNQEEQSNIKINSIKKVVKQNKPFIEVALEAYRGNTGKSVVEITLEQEQTLTQKIKIKEKFSSLESTLLFPLEHSRASSITVKGLDEELSKDFSFESEAKDTTTKPNKLIIENIYTRQKYLKDNVTIYLRIEGENEITISVKTSSKIFSFNEILEGAKTIPLVLENISHNESLLIIVNQDNYFVNETFVLELEYEEKERIEREEIYLNISQNNHLTGFVVGEKPIYSSKTTKTAIFVTIASVLALSIDRKSVV